MNLWLIPRLAISRAAPVQMGGVSAIGGVRNPESAAKKLAESKIEIRGAMIQQAGCTPTLLSR